MLGIECDAELYFFERGLMSMNQQMESDNSAMNQFISVQNFWLGVLSFFVPVIGIVLAIVWWQEKHHTAKIVLICAIVPTALSILLCGLSLLFGTLAMTNLV